MRFSLFREFRPTRTILQKRHSLDCNVLINGVRVLGERERERERLLEELGMV